MKTIDLNEMSVRELKWADAMTTEGGLTTPVTTAWWSALVAYVKYSMETGGQNVTYHAQ
jgi:hypothetical protein